MLLVVVRPGRLSSQLTTLQGNSGWAGTELCCPAAGLALRHTAATLAPAPPRATLWRHGPAKVSSPASSSGHTSLCSHQPHKGESRTKITILWLFNWCKEILSRNYFSVSILLMSVDLLTNLTTLAKWCSSVFITTTKIRFTDKTTAGLPCTAQTVVFLSTPVDFWRQSCIIIRAEVAKVNS